MPTFLSLSPVVLLAAVGPQPTVVVRGDTACPSAAEVTATLTGLVAPLVGSAPTEIVELADRGSSVSLRLVGESGEILAEKGLPESQSCAERAQTAAVIVAAWEARLRDGSHPVPPLPSATFTTPSPLAPKTVSGPTAFAQAVVSSKALTNCAVQKVASYALGTPIRVNNTCELQPLRTQFDQSSGTISSLVSEVALANFLRARAGGSIQ